MAKSRTSTPATRRDLTRDLSVTAVRSTGFDFPFRSILQGDPSATLRRVSAKTSKTGAYNLWYVINATYYDFLDEMASRDPIKSALKKMCSFVLNRRDGFKMKDEDADHPMAMEIVEACRDHLTKVPNRRFSWGAMRRMSLLKRFAHGTAFHRINWTVDEETLRWVPEGYYNEHPGRFVFNKEGELFFHKNSTDPEPVPALRFIVHGPAGEYGNPYGHSIIYDHQYDYGMRQAALKTWMHAADKYGLPIPTAQIPSGADKDEYAHLKTEMENAFGLLSESAGLIIPSGVEVNWEQRSGGQSTFPHEGIVNYFDRSMTRSLLGAILQTMEAEHGSRAQATEHTKSEHEELKPPSGELEETIQSSLVDPFVALNFPPTDADGKPMPVPVYFIDIADPKDIAQNRETIKAALEFGMDVPKAWSYEALEIPQPQEGEEILENIPEPEPPIAAIEKVDQDGDQESADPDADESEDMAAMGAHRQFAASRQRVRVIEERFNGRANRIAEEISEIHLRSATADWRSAINNIKPQIDGNQRMPTNVAAAAQFRVTDVSELIAPGIVATRMLAVLAIKKLVDAQLPGMFAGTRRRHEVAIFQGGLEALDDIAVVDERFRTAATWMLERDIMLVSEVRDMAEALAALDRIANIDFFERLLREEILALHVGTSRAITTAFQNSIATSVAEGQTRTQWLEGIDQVFGLGKLPGGSDAYLTNVYRTETAKAYGEQRRQQLQDPEIQDHFWGVEYFNPADDRSRESHEALDEKLIQKGSGAYILLGQPPFSYQCRCDLSPVMVDDLKDPGVEESPGVFELVSNIERFWNADAIFAHHFQAEKFEILEHFKERTRANGNSNTAIL